jgi:DNA ligase-1
MSASWILKLNQSDSRLHKEEVIRQALTATKLGSVNAQTFLELTKAAYDPYLTYGIRQVPDTVGIIDAENPWSEFKDLLVDLSNRKFTGHAARDAVQAMAERFNSEEWNVFCAAVLRRDLRAGVSDKTINKICKKTEYEIPIFGCQLAANSEGRPEMKGIKRLEPKLDGVRVLMMVFPRLQQEVSGEEVTICFSRNGKIFDNFTHIEDQVKKNTSKLLQAFKKVDQGRGMTDGFVLDG